MLSFLNLDDNVRLETRGNVCAIKNLSTNSFHLKKNTSYVAISKQ